MDKKQKIFVGVIGFAVSAGIGAGSVYLANYRKIDFMNRYPYLLEADKFVEDTLEISKPESDKNSELSAYFTLFGDKYTSYEGGEDYHSKEYALGEVNEVSSAKLGGYKVQFNENDEPYFSAVVEGMPADEQGIKVGDIIKNIDDMDITKYNHLIRLNGDNGTTAKLIIERDGKELQIDYIRHADDYEQKGIDTKMYGQTLYVSVKSMTLGISELFDEDIKDKNFDSIVIDLRGNGGGYTDEAVRVADLFIGESQTVMHAYSGREEIYSTTDEVKYNVPMVVLTNEKTASAAEILTALLKQYGDTTLVGMNTLGKGIYQINGTFMGGGVRYTEGYVTVGDWECYHGIGIKPDIEIDMDSDYIGTDKDIQLEKALKIVEEKSRD